MLAASVRLIADELGYYVEQNRHPDDLIQADDVILNNIADYDKSNGGGGVNNLDDKIIITTVNVEEESTLKNKRALFRNAVGGIDYLNPPVHINLYLLFCTTVKEQGNSSDNYEMALFRLSLIIEFFQSKKLFTVQNSPYSKIATDVTISESIKEELKINMELYTLTFEQINHLWGSLGGKQVPFVMYKARLVKIQKHITDEAPLIEQIENNFETLADC